MHSNFNERYTIFFNGDFSGEVQWVDKRRPDEVYVIPEDVVKLLKRSLCANLIDTMHDRLIDIMWEEL